MKRTFLFFNPLFFLFSAFQSIAADTTTVNSPDKQVQFKLFQQGNQLQYLVMFKKGRVVNPSPIIFSLDNAVLTEQSQIGKANKYTVNETYPWLGVHAVAINQCNGAQIPIIQNVLDYTLDVRVYNNGVAFRFVLPGQPDISRVPDEATTFNLPVSSTAWYHDLNMHYEGVHVKRQLSQVKEGEWMAPPATFKLPDNIYVSITEADLHAYGGMALQANGKGELVVRLPQHQSTSYPYKLRYSPEDTLRLSKPASISGTITTPWRVVMIGADLNAMVNNDIVHNLCPPPDAAFFPQGIHTDWIRPGRAVWKYLDGGGDGSLAVMKHFTDAAASLGFEHNILEGFWARWPQEELKELVDYSKQKGVGIWLWKHSKNLRNPAARDSFFKLCHALDITGAKIDFFDHEAKETIDLYEALLKEAAQYHVLLDFHGANKPTGLMKSYPNNLVYEAVKGMEASKLEDRATHETTIPFTRFLAGPAEYTVVHFGERRRNTTWAHQLASAAILSAPLLTYAANPDSLLKNPAVGIIKNIPATWDETIVLPPSEIGELAVYARRKGTTWFLAVMNGVKPKKFKLSLFFLNGRYKTSIAKDNGNNPASVITESKTYSANDTVVLDLVSGGGFIAQFSKQ